MMKRTNIFKARRLNQIHSLPVIHNYRNKSNNNSINNISSTTNASMVRHSINNSTSISNRSLLIFKKIKKIKLNDKYNSQRSINNNEINPSNTKKRTIEILNNADKIVRERLKFNGLGKPILKRDSLMTSKEICYKNYSIKLLKESRINLNEKEFIYNKALKDFSDQYEKDHKKFVNFVEDIKNKIRNEEDSIIDFRQIREKKENLYEKERLLNKKLYENLERKIRELYILKGYGSFFHRIIEKKFIYDGIPEIKAREKNHEIIADIMINIYEYEDKYNELPKELGNIDSFMKKYMLLEDNILSNISDKEIADKEKNNIQKNSKYELEQLQLSKTEYESDLNYLKNEIKNVKIEMKNYKIHEDENFDNYLNYIIELGKEIETNGEIPIITDKKYLTDLILYSKNILKILGKIENKINTNILTIENILNYGKIEDINLMKKLILNQKNKNKREKQLKIKEKQDEMKVLKNKQIIERAKKIVLSGRKIIFDYPSHNNKYNIKKVIKKENDDNDLDLEYCNSDENNKI